MATFSDFSKETMLNAVRAEATHIQLHNGDPGAVVGEATPVGSMRKSSQHDGNVIGEASLQGAIQATAPSQFAGTVVGEASLTGAIQKSAQVSGNVVGVGEPTASIDKVSQHSGTVVGEASLQGGIAYSTTHSGNVVAEASLEGSVRKTAQMGGAVVAEASLQGAIETEESAPLSGNVVGVGELTGSIQKSAHLSGNGVGVGSLVGAIRKSVTVSGTVNGIATLSGEIERLSYSADVYALHVDTQEEIVLDVHVEHPTVVVELDPALAPAPRPPKKVVRFPSPRLDVRAELLPVRHEVTIIPFLSAEFVVDYALKGSIDVTAELTGDFD